MARVGVDVGADVEHDRLSTDGRPEGCDRRARDARDRAQADFGDRHEGAGVAGADGDLGFVGADGFDRAAHRGVAAAAEGLARLLVHRDDAVAMHDLRDVLQRGFAEEDRLQLRVVAVQQELDLGVTQVRDRDAIDNGLRGVVAAHRVNRNDDFAVHASPIL